MPAVQIACHNERLEDLLFGNGEPEASHVEDSVRVLLTH
jgi:hypothetical protein